MLETVFGKFNVNDKVVATYIPSVCALGTDKSASIEGNIKGVREVFGRKYIQILPNGKAKVLEFGALGGIETLKRKQPPKPPTTTEPSKPPTTETNKPTEPPTTETQKPNETQKPQTETNKPTEESKPVEENKPNTETAKPNETQKPQTETQTQKPSETTKPTETQKPQTETQKPVSK